MCTTTEGVVAPVAAASGAALQWDSVLYRDQYCAWEASAPGEVRAGAERKRLERVLELPATLSQSSAFPLSLMRGGRSGSCKARLQQVWSVICSHQEQTAIYLAHGYTR